MSDKLPDSSLSQLHHLRAAREMWDAGARLRGVIPSFVLVFVLGNRQDESTTKTPSTPRKCQPAEVTLLTRDPETPRPRDPETPRPRDPETPRPRDPETPRPDTIAQYNGLMAFIDYVPAEDWKLDPDNILRIHGVNPSALRAHWEIYRASMFGESPLSRVQREMIAVVVSAVNGCHY